MLVFLSFHPRRQTPSDILIRENRVTMLVITLVVIFLICHTPNAVYSLYKFWLSGRQSFSDEKKIKNLILGEFTTRHDEKSRSDKKEGKGKKKKILHFIWFGCKGNVLLVTVKVMENLINRERRCFVLRKICQAWVSVISRTVLLL